MSEKELSGSRTSIPWVTIGYLTYFVMGASEYFGILRANLVYFRLLQGASDHLKPTELNFDLKQLRGTLGYFVILRDTLGYFERIRQFQQQLYENFFFD